ncbi:MAG: acyl-CoA thioesterase [Phycisphaeraceae bacterium]|nr:acyl-CoA thioesterase [Phycisphaeraceae bacterium]
MPSTFRLTRRVAFSETDAAGIVHFAHFFRYMEDAEHAMLRDLGLSVHRDIGDDVAGFPRVKAACDYKKPLRFEDVFTIDVYVAAKTDKSVSYGFTFRTEDQPDPIATGTLKVVHAIKPAGAGKFKAATLPPEIDAALKVTEPSDP